jgi:hypothetical protein
LANVVWANVSGQMSLGQYLWANVVSANVIEPMRLLQNPAARNRSHLLGTYLAPRSFKKVLLE